MSETGAYTKSSLISELAASNKLSKAAVGRLLDQMAHIAYREAANGFVVPGLCKLKVVTRKASRHRNPFTGKLLVIGERLALKIVPLKKAKTAITPNTGVSVDIIDDLQPLAIPPQPPPAPAAPPPAAAPVPPAAAPSSLPGGEEGQIVFPCPECGSMIAAPAKTAGQQGECPFCKAGLTVPRQSAPPKAEKQVLTDPAAATPPSLADFITFVCKACGQEIEAPVDMVGMAVECPTCGTGLTVPVASAPKPPPVPRSAPGGDKKEGLASMTIRIDLSDLGQ